MYDKSVVGDMMLSLPAIRGLKIRSMYLHFYHRTKGWPGDEVAGQAALAKLGDAPTSSGIESTFRAYFSQNL